jgi:predicted protein tyrosine phosphatase
MNILFVCEFNQVRSRTAEAIYQENNQVKVLSAGTHPRARVELSEALIEWADIIFAMEEEQEEYILEYFPHALGHRKLVNLDIYKPYGFMDEILVKEIREKVEPWLN